MMSDSPKAVFLSYASQDAEAARRICEALRSGGVEVWFDADGGLEHGDEWDAKIRKQIKECVLFIPVISASTQARHEGYFRLEWELAAQRAMSIASGVAFILPVVIDDTREPEALVPDRFRMVQWTRLLGGVVTPEVKARYLKLWSHLTGALKHESEVARAFQPVSSSSENTGWKARATLHRRIPTAAWIGAFVVALAVAAIWGFGRRNAAAVAQSMTRTPDAKSSADNSPAGSAELARLRAALVPDRWQKEDFDTVSATLDRLIQANPELADAWALRSIINSLQVMRNFDPGTKPLEAGKSAANRALSLAPGLPLGEIALGLHLVAMISRGGDALAYRPHIERGVAASPRDALTRYAELTSLWLGYDFDGAQRSARAWLDAEPDANFPAWILAQWYGTKRQPAEVEKWALIAAKGQNITGVRALYTLFESRYYLGANLASAREALQRIPAGGRAVHRVVHAHWLLAMSERQWDGALQELAQLPEPFLLDRTCHGPKALLAGLAHQRAGRVDAAAAQFREAERLLKAQLATDSDNEEFHAVLAVTFACAGRAAEAHNELALVEPLVKGRAPNIYRGGLVLLIAQTYAALEEWDPLIFWLRNLLTEPSGFPFTPASLRVDPRFASATNAPAIQSLLGEFASLDARPAQADAASPVPPDAKSVAVLAFANLSDDKGNEFFSDGIADELLTTLQKIPGLRVAARTSAFSFKGRNSTVQEVGEKLGCAHVVEGAVQKSGSRVKITARLSRAATNEELWSRSFGPLELTDVFATQREIAQAIVGELRGRLTGDGAATAQAEIAAQVMAAQRGGTRNPEAFRPYLQGKFHYARGSSADVAQSITFYEQAIAADRAFAAAWAAVARARVWQGSFEPLVTERFRQARAAAEQALALEPNLAEGHSVMSQVLQRHYFEWSKAREASDRALRLAPDDADVLTDACMVGQVFGDWERCIAAGRRAVRLDPVNPEPRLFLAITYFHSGRLSEAEAEIRRACELAPAGVFLRLIACQILLGAGRTQEALAEAKQETGRMHLLEALALAEFASGRRRESDAALKALESEFADSCPFQIAEVYAARNDPTPAFKWLEHGWQVKDPGTGWVRVAATLKNLHRDPRWPALLKKVGLSDDQLK